MAKLYQTQRCNKPKTLMNKYTDFDALLNTESVDMYSNFGNEDMWKGRRGEKMTPIKKDKIKKRDGNTCKYCGCTNKLILTIDHQIPKSQGGSNAKENLICCCIPCNQLKGNLSDEEFIKYMEAVNILYDLGLARVEAKIFEIRFKSTMNR